MNNKSSVAHLPSLALFALLACTNMVAAQPVALGYSQVVAEARRIERLEGGEYFISKDVLFKPVRLNLKNFGGGSDAMYVSTPDEIGFVCAPALKNFSGGWIEGRIEKHEPGSEGGHFFTLSGCRRVGAQ